MKQDDEQEKAPESPQAALDERRRAALAESARRRFVKSPPAASPPAAPDTALPEEAQAEQEEEEEKATWQAFKARRPAAVRLPECENGAPEDAATTYTPPEASHTLRWALGVFGLNPEDLGLGSFGLEDLQRLYHLKSRMFHPDRVDQKNPTAQAHAQARMSELNEARDLLLAAINQE